MNDQSKGKALLRSEMRSRIKAQDANEAMRASEKIVANLQDSLNHSLPDFARAAIFLATEHEPNIDAFARWLQRRGVLVCAPHSCKNEKPFVSIHDDWSNISLNQRGWREPGEYSGFQQFAAKEMDLVLMPALAFDETGARLGQGGGWYDRALAGLPTRVLTVGIAFHFQIIDFVPREAHDQNVALIVTDQRAIEIL